MGLVLQGIYWYDQVWDWYEHHLTCQAFENKETLHVLWLDYKSITFMKLARYETILHDSDSALLIDGHADGSFVIVLY